MGPAPDAAGAGGLASGDGRSTDGTNRVAAARAGFWTDRTTGVPGGGTAATVGAARGGPDGGEAGSSAAGPGAAPSGFPHPAQLVAPGSL
jgi:hypothetical protein